MLPKKLGWLSQKYESGNLGPTAISNLKGDPGGVSYGTYQLASNTNTLQAFLIKYNYNQYFKWLKPGTKDFNSQWIEMCKKQDFCDNQHEFIKETLYQPIKNYTKKLEFPENPALDEVIFSMAVQHGKAKKLITTAAEEFDNHITKSIQKLISILYKVRWNYIKTLELQSSLIETLLKRYYLEEQEVINYLNEVTNGNR